MRNKPGEFAKGEPSMSDYQFKTYVELRDKYDAVVQELNFLRQNNPRINEDGMTDYQFRQYEKLRNKHEQIEQELALLREENIKLQIQAEMLRALANEKR